MRIGRIVAAALVASAATVASSAAPAPAAETHRVISFTNFNGTTGLTYAGGAAAVVPGKGTPKVLRLTRYKPGQAGAAWAGVKLDPGMSFATTFVVRTKSPRQPGDGVAFVLRGAAATKTVGGGGGGLGYSGIEPSVAVEFDTFRNTHDINANHVDVVTGGNSEVSESAVKSPVNLGASTFRARVTYDAATHALRVWLTPAGKKGYGKKLIDRRVDVAGVVGDSPISVGFTGATGTAYSYQDVVSWTLDVTG